MAPSLVEKESAMKNSARNLVAMIVLGLGVMAPTRTGPAGPRPYRDLSAQWWQWATSIPTPDNPLTDTTGENCMVGQRGDVWFLAGAAFGGEVTRSCTVPENKKIFFPIVNILAWNSPNVCGQDSENLSVDELFEGIHPFIEGITDAYATVDGRLVRHERRVRSDAFEITVPEENLFDAFCPENVPAGIYSPSVDEGIYVLLPRLSPGEHTIVINAENSDAGFDLHITYKLNVEPVLLE
ncbi:hypothetical protein sce8365 [Sorangium cellulosum So ce56]|uniref:Uncharacterized protein n=2 Tax=Sorangium cellulosum TaxID=56 RepID=A9FTI9_SORC5|nr:hypothetical protein sce8365 [Sorangium cellulosum So ce56]